MQQVLSPCFPHKRKTTWFQRSQTERQTQCIDCNLRVCPGCSILVQKASDTKNRRIKPITGNRTNIEILATGLSSEFYPCTTPGVRTPQLGKLHRVSRRFCLQNCMDWKKNSLHFTKFQGPKLYKCFLFDAVPFICQFLHGFHASHAAEIVNCIFWFTNLEWLVTFWESPVMIYTKVLVIFSISGLFAMFCVLMSWQFLFLFKGF